MGLQRSAGSADWAKSLPAMPIGPEEWRQVVQRLKLSPQQARIVELILRGMRDKQIAAEMGLKFSTVRTYLGRIFIHLGVEDRVELILRVFDERQKINMPCPQN